VTRIVGGLARGRRLAVPPLGTRPTSERAREALFNSIRTELDLAGSRVLDLYAGSGAVGLEALSHGAATAVLVEWHKPACTVIEANIAVVQLPGAQLVRQSVDDYLNGPPPEQPFDLIFADPPYALESAAVSTVIGAILDGGFLSPDGVVVLERFARDPDPRWPTGLLEYKRRRYGDTQLLYGRRAASTPDLSRT
jgi:16S rRNA (guanine966-N2)-methyltransferase